MDVNEFKKVLAEAREKKKLVLGFDKTVSMLKQGKVKLLVYASNNPHIPDLDKYAQLAKVETFPFPKDGLALGELCKRPFSVSTLAVVK